MAGIADRQHGVVTRAQLLSAGVSSDEIKERLKRGALLQAHRGVYRVGHEAPNVYAAYMAAVLACGHGALLRAHAAGHLLGLLKRPPSVPEVLARTERRIEGVSTLRTRRAIRGTLWFGIPVTTPAQTIIDLAADLSAEELARACHEAEVRHRTTPAQVEAILGRSRGAAKLRAVLRGDTRVTLSALERKFLKLLRTADLPLPITNGPAGAHRVDCRWPAQRLTVELDSYRFHNSRHAWERDRRRERDAYRRGDEIRRYTHDDVFLDAAAMLAELAELLV